MDDGKVAAALITGIGGTLLAAIVAGLVSILVTRWQLRGKVDELTQTQLKDILVKRIEVYPVLWRILQSLLSDWERERKLKNPDWQPDLDWAKDLLEQLIEWHKENGVFLSQPTYVVFSTLRNELVDLIKTCGDERRDPTLAEFEHLDRIYYAGDPTKAGGDPLRWPLGYWLKNDLGSYKTPFLAALATNS